MSTIELDKQFLEPLKVTELDCSTLNKELLATLPSDYQTHKLARAINSDLPPAVRYFQWTIKKTVNSEEERVVLQSESDPFINKVNLTWDSKLITSLYTKPSLIPLLDLSELKNEFRGVFFVFLCSELLKEELNLKCKELGIY